MGGSRRVYGLVAGGITAVLCIGDVISHAFEFGQWRFWVPLIVLTLLGAHAYIDVIQENHRREKILRKHGIDEQRELV
jgi:hypothetical protein